ncbi:DUF3298 domain-containing protein [Parabacteroides distasonis]|nr:DUF3298 domain-containing protein [Parabacteroides distasonis]
MKTSFMYPVLLFCLSVLLMTNCQMNTKNGTKNDIAFDSIQVDLSYHLLDNSENPNCNLQVHFVYPVRVADNTHLEAIQKQFIVSYFGENYESMSPQEAVRKYQEDYLAMYKELEEDFEKDRKDSDNPVGAWYSYYESSTDAIVFNRMGILSYTVRFENYTGGAHGGHSYNNYVIDLSTGKAITEEDIFIKDYQDKLAQIIVNQLAKDNHVEDPKELENVGFFSVEDIFPNGNFLIHEQGITYYFNEYEIAPYVIGLVQVDLPYSDIRHLLQPESIISPLINS